MDCLDCLLDSRQHSVAVGTCVDCGAGVCLDHAVILEHWLTRAAAIMREVPVEPPARLIRCATCDAPHRAERGHQLPHPADDHVTAAVPLPLHVLGRR
jgi:hypothetical protein